jgi:hypothetical protein
MSLKAFHIVLILFSTMLACGLGSWCIWVYLETGVGIYVAGAGACFACGLALTIYGIWFYRKMKRLGIIS